MDGPAILPGNSAIIRGRALIATEGASMHLRLPAACPHRALDWVHVRPLGDRSAKVRVKGPTPLAWAIRITHTGIVAVLASVQLGGPATGLVIDDESVRGSGRARPFGRH